MSSNLQPSLGPNDTSIWHTRKFRLKVERNRNKEKSQEFMPDLSEAGISKLTFFPFFHSASWAGTVYLPSECSLCLLQGELSTSIIKFTLLQFYILNLEQKALSNDVNQLIPHALMLDSLPNCSWNTFSLSQTDLEPSDMFKMKKSQQSTRFHVNYQVPSR